MNIIEALKSGRPMRRDLPKFSGSDGKGWMSNQFIKMSLLAGPYMSGLHLSVNVKPSYALDEEDLLADDWTIQNDWREEDEITIIK